MNNRMLSDLVAKAEQDSDRVVNGTLQLLDSAPEQLMLMGAVAAQFTGLCGNLITMAHLKKVGKLPATKEEANEKFVSSQECNADAVTFAACVIRRMALAKQAFIGGDDEIGYFDPAENLPAIMEDFKQLTGKDYNLSVFRGQLH